MSKPEPLQEPAVGAEAELSSEEVLSRWGIPVDPVIEVYKQHVDRSLLRENLKLTPEERLRKLQAHLEFAVELRRAGEALRHD